jgi:peptide/nickel transport system substrate-binding protein
MIGLGLTAPMATQMLRQAGVARAQPRTPAFLPVRRGGGGQLRILWWQAPTLLNPHFGAGTKDQDGSRVFYEPLAGFDPDGTLVPVLAAEIPSVENGGLAKDGTWVIWNLKKGVTWHDGRPFTAADVLFTWEYSADPATATVTIGTYDDLRVEKLGDHTVKVVFKKPTPYWFDAFCSWRGMILPRHLFEAYTGAKSREAPTNLKPVGTGPYRFVDFKPGDTVRAEINPNYHVPNRPFFDQLEMKGGGDAVSAARAVMQTGKGRADIVPGAAPEHIQLNQTDPWREVDGERASIKTGHPFLTEPAVREALNLLVDRAAIHEQIYGRLGQTSANFLNAPARFYSKGTRWEFNVNKANQILDAAGWKRGADGVRAKDGRRLKMLFQTSINAPRQKTQAIVKQAAAKAGIELELKSVVSSVFFSSDAGNSDTYGHFYSDLQMYTTTMGAPDPQTFMEQFASWQCAARDNKWAKRNITRWRNEEYDRLWKAAETEMDPLKRAAHFIRMNDLVIQNVVVIPVLWRNVTSAVSNRLHGTDVTTWDSNLWRLAYWYRA